MTYKELWRPSHRLGVGWLQGIRPVNEDRYPTIAWSRSAALTLGVITTAMLGSACRPGTRGAPSSPPPTVLVTAREYAFDAPDSIEAGPTTLRLVSQGKEQHFLQLVRIASPHTLADYQGTLSASTSPSWVTAVGGVGTIGPGGAAMTTIDLEPGRYAMVCDMQDPHGTPHMMEGMFRQLTVLNRRNRAVMPTADAILGLTEYAFLLSTPLKAGFQVVDVHNIGSQAHLVLLWQLRPGKSAGDVRHWMNTPSDTGPAPVTVMGGTPDLDPGQKAQLPLDLKPGHYLLICLVEDEHDHTAHYNRGMIQELVVQ